MSGFLMPMELGTQITFWVCAPLMVLLALGMVFTKKAVHSAIFLAGVMVLLAAIYAALDAPFLFVVQIIVYTGAILMLFLFVVMLIGVDVRESFKETIKGHRIIAGLTVVTLLALLVTVAIQLKTLPARGFAAEEKEKNIEGLAELLFSNYVFAFELTSALLITGVVGAMVLAHQERIVPKLSQGALQRRRIQDYARTGAHPGARPNSGVFARSNSIATPGLLPDGSVAESSVSAALRDRGTVTDVTAIAAATAQVYDEIDSATRGELDK